MCADNTCVLTFLQSLHPQKKNGVEFPVSSLSSCATSNEELSSSFFLSFNFFICKMGIKLSPFGVDIKM